MAKKIVILLMIFLVGCSNKEIVSYINEDDFVSINYPITNINILDDKISTYINHTYSNFKSMKNNSELNISYTYKEVNEDIVSVGLKTEIVSDKTINKIKTFTYNKKSKKFLSLENIVEDLDALDYEIKKELLDKYSSADMDYLSNVSYDYFTIDDENLTLYFNPAEIKSTHEELIYIDIPLNSLSLLINFDESKKNDTYLSIKKKNVSLDDKVVALTFDDGPSKYTSSVLDILKKYDAAGTFFLVGNKVEFYSDVLKRMLNEGSDYQSHFLH